MAISSGSILSSFSVNSKLLLNCNYNKSFFIHLIKLSKLEVVGFQSRYLNEQKLPKRMLRLRSGTGEDECESVSGDDEGSDSGEDCIGDERIQRTLEGLRTSPLVIGDLQVISFGSSLFLVLLLFLIFFLVLVSS